MQRKVVIYTDGGCRGNPGIGGWGVVLYYKDKEKQLYGTEEKTTNNRMELTACIKALEVIKTDIQIIIYTDSKYVLLGITEWITNWKKKNWKNVKNIDLWKRLDELNHKYTCEWKWVKGHSGNLGNDLADKLANKAMDEA